MTSTLPVSTNGNGSVSQNGKLPALDSRVSDRIRARLREQDVSFLANDNVADHILPGELDDLQVEVADRVVARVVKAEEEGRWQEDVRKPEFVVFAS